MLYSAKYNSVFIRTPKAGSTTMSTYLLDSGLFNANTDIYYTEVNQELYASTDGTITLEALDVDNSKIIRVKNPRVTTTMPHVGQNARTNKVAIDQVKRSFFISNPRATEAEYEAYQNSRNGARDIIKHVFAINNPGEDANLPTSADEIDGKTILPIAPQNVHATYSDLVSQNIIPEDAKCFSTIRNPIARWVSAINAVYSLEDIEKEGLDNLTSRLLVSMEQVKAEIKDDGQRALTEYTLRNFLPNGLNQMLLTHQHWFVSNDATLWPTEDITRVLPEFILSKGGRVRADWTARVNETKALQPAFSSETLQRLEAFYATDLALWEKAKATYGQ